MKSKACWSPKLNQRCRVAWAAFGLVTIGVISGGLTPSLADEGATERGDRLIFTYQIYDDGSVDAAWGAGTKPTTTYEPELRTANVEILLPPDIVERLEAAEQNDFSEAPVEILVFVSGSVYGTRCHYVSGSKHCHSNSN